MDMKPIPRTSRSSVPVDAEAPARVLGGSCIVLTAMGFLSVTLAFDPVAARHAIGNHAAVLMDASRASAAAPVEVPSPAAVTVAAPERRVPAAAPERPASAERPRAPEAEPTGARGPDPSHKPAPRTAKPKPSVLPRATPEDEVMVKAAIAKRMTALSRCYERALLRRPGLSGKLSVRVEVAPDGRIASAKVRHDTLRDPWLATCTTERIQGWRLPRLQDDASVVVTIPVTFVR